MSEKLVKKAQTSEIKSQKVTRCVRDEKLPTSVERIKTREKSLGFVKKK